MSLGAIAKDVTAEWSESGYRRIAVADLSLDHPISRILRIYETLPRLQRYPAWHAFDMDGTAADLSRHIALGNPVYSPENEDVPGFYVYSYDGASVRALIGRSMVGLPMGYVMRNRSRNSLLHEIETAMDQSVPVFSTSFLDIEGKTDYGFDRGVFLFEGDDGRVAKLMLVLVRNERTRNGTSLWSRFGTAFGKLRSCREKL